MKILGTERALSVLAGCGALAVALTASVPPARADQESRSVRERGGPRPSRTETTETTVVVTAIDKTSRHLTTKNPDGEARTFQVSPDVKAFDNLKVGDKVDVEYTETVELSLLSPGNKPTRTERKRPLPGGVSRQLSVSAAVVSVDVANSKVTLKGPNEETTTVTVTEPSLQARLPNLKPGQMLQVTYTEALATHVRPSLK